VSYGHWKFKNISWTTFSFQVTRPFHSSGSQSLASHYRGLDSIPGQSHVGSAGGKVSLQQVFLQVLQFSSHYHSTNVPFSFVHLLPMQQNLSIASSTHWKNRLPSKQSCRTNRSCCTPFFSIPQKYEQIAKSHERRGKGNQFLVVQHTMEEIQYLLDRMWYHTTLVQPLFQQWQISSTTEAQRP
jgi:hypothetical protein